MNDWWFLEGVFVGVLLMGIIAGSIMLNIEKDIQLSQETGDTICKNLTNNTAVHAETDGNGKLVCVKPSFDHTTNIIVKEADK